MISADYRQEGHLGKARIGTDLHSFPPVRGCLTTGKLPRYDARGYLPKAYWNLTLRRPDELSHLSLVLA
ncbi:MAG TPA: hypothetical protein VFE46_02590 [Pirellulales bacterium]|nr:hypothetical protein [Pirellulales bacterium]